MALESSWRTLKRHFAPLVRTPLAEAMPSVLSGVTGCVKLKADTPLAPHYEEVPKPVLYGGVVTGRVNVDGAQVRIPGAYVCTQNVPSNFMVEDVVLDDDVVRRYTFPYSDSSMTIDAEMHECVRALLLSKPPEDVKEALQPMGIWITQSE